MSKKFIATRYHDISVGHRVTGHPGACANLHGHNYRIHFNVAAIQDGLDELGVVLDFGVIKQKLCRWIEGHWDHRFLIWNDDISASYLRELDSTVVVTSYNPTAEGMAEHLVEVIGPIQLAGTGCELVSVVVEETAKCSVTYTKRGASCPE